MNSCNGSFTTLIYPKVRIFVLSRNSSYTTVGHREYSCSSVSCRLSFKLICNTTFRAVICHVTEVQQRYKCLFVSTVRMLLLCITLLYIKSSRMKNAEPQLKNVLSLLRHSSIEYLSAWSQTHQCTMHTSHTLLESQFNQPSLSQHS